MKAVISHPIRYYFVLLFVSSVSYLVAEQQFNYRYRYNFWPPLSWQQKKVDKTTLESWKQQSLHFEISISDARNHRSLREATAYALLQKKAEVSLLKVTAEKSIWDTWAKGLDEACLRVSLLEAETLLCSWTSKKTKVQDSGWLLTLYNNHYYYTITAWSDEPLVEQSAALLLSLLDSFALQGQQSWEAGIISKLQQRFFYEKFTREDQQESSNRAEPQQPVFRKDRVQWSSPRWKAIEAMNKTLMARERIVVGEGRSASTIERFYFFLFRSNISSFSRILKLIPAPLALWDPQKSQFEEDERTLSTTDKLPIEEEAVQEESIEPENSENDIDFSYLFEDQENRSTNEEEEEDFSALFSLGKENNLSQSNEEEEEESFTTEEPAQEADLPFESISDATTDESEDTNEESALQRWVKLQQRRLPLVSKTASLPEQPLIETEKLYQLLYSLQDKKTGKKTDFDPLLLEPPLMEFWSEKKDLQTLYLSAVLLLSQLGYPSALLYSWDYKTTLLAVETAGEGARFSWFSRSYLLFDLSEKVYAGWVPASTLDLQNWQVLTFPAFSRQTP